MPHCRFHRADSILNTPGNSLQDMRARDAALTLLLATLEFHRSGLERLTEMIADAGDRNRLASDPLVSSLLLWHDLHPLDLETRNSRTLSRPEFRSCAGHVELISIRQGVVRVRIDGSPEFLSAVELAIVEAAPDMAWLQIEGRQDQASLLVAGDGLAHSRATVTRSSVRRVLG